MSAPAKNVITLLIIGCLVLPLVALAQESTPEAGQDCAECHLDVVADWQNSIHALAYLDPTFQAAWQEYDSDSLCLSCHTTGFVPRTGEYMHEGVTCTACHGETPANHPPEPVSIDPGVEVCADCHTTTFNEWQMSAHGEQQLACTTCHTPHQQALRFETSDLLCLNCHDEARDDFAHVTHLEQACVDCHWYRNLDETQHILTGNLLPTGHDNQVVTSTCIDCHESQSETVAALSTPSTTHPLLDAQVQIGELRAEIQTVRAQSQNNAALQIVQGLIAGAVVMGFVVAGFAFLRTRRARSAERSSDE